MNSTAAVRNENSVQASLTELRQIHAARLEAEKQDALRRRLEAEAKKIEAERLRSLEEQQVEERRVAAEHDLELAKERARLEAEARLHEKRLAIELKQAEITHAQVAHATHNAARNAGETRRAPLIALVIVLLGLQAALLWQQRRADNRLQRVSHSVSELEERNRATKRTLGDLQASLGELRIATERAQSRTTEDRSQPKASPKKPPRNRASTTRRRKPEPRSKPLRPAIDVSECAKSPLGCLDQ